MTQDVLITPESGIIEFSNNATVSASIVLDSANSRLKVTDGTLETGPLYASTLLSGTSPSAGNSGTSLSSVVINRNLGDTEGGVLDPGLLNTLAGASSRFTVVATNDGVGFSLGDDIFQGDSKISTVVVADAALDEVVITISDISPAMISTTYVGVNFHSPSFRAKDVKIEVFRNSAWQTECDLTNQESGSVIRRVAVNDANGISQIRYTFKNVAWVVGSYFRITNLFALNYQSNYAVDGYFLNRYTDNDLYGNITLKSGSDLTLESGAGLTYASGVTTTFNAGSTVQFNNTTGTSPFTVASTTKVANLNADLLDGLSASSFVRRDAVFAGAVTINTNTGDFIVTSNPAVQADSFLWKDHSASTLYIGTSAAVPKFRSHAIFQTTNNVAPPTDDLHVSGFGIMGTRASPIYLTNTNAAGSITLGVGGIHGSGTQVTVSATSMNVVNGSLSLGGTVRITNTGNFYPSSILSAGRLSFLNGNVAQGIRTNSVYAGITYSADAALSGEMDALNGYRAAGVKIIEGNGDINAKDITIASGTAGTNTAGLVFEETDSTAAAYIKRASYWLEYSASSAAGHKFIDSASESLLDLRGSTAGVRPHSIDITANNGLYMNGTQIINPFRQILNIGNTIRMSSANAFLRQEETGITNTPEWWTGADGGSFSIRLNNSGVYPLTFETNATNDAVSQITFGYPTEVASTLNVTGNSTLNTATFSTTGVGTIVKIISAVDQADGAAKLLIATDADTTDDLAFEIRGNSTGANVDTSTTMTSADTKFAVFGNGHTTIGYNNLGTTYTAVGTYGLNVSGGVSTTTGYWLGTTQVIDSSRNLLNMGTGSFSGHVKLLNSNSLYFKTGGDEIRINASGASNPSLDVYNQTQTDYANVRANTFISEAAAPTSASHLTRKDYVDSADALRGSLAGTNAWTGANNFDSDTNNIPFRISRTGGNANQLLNIGVDDQAAVFRHIGDEANEGRFRFYGDPTDAPNTLLLEINMAGVFYQGDEIYHEGYKPTIRDLSGVPSTYWTSFNDIIDISNYAIIGSEGSYKTSWVWNGYRNNASGFTYRGVNGNTTTASNLEHDSSGLYWRAGVASGTALPLKFSVASDGDMTLTGTISATGGTLSGEIALDNGTADSPGFSVRDSVNNTFVYMDLAGEHIRWVTSYRAATEGIGMKLAANGSRLTVTGGITAGGDSTITGDLTVQNTDGLITIRDNNNGGTNAAYKLAFNDVSNVVRGSVSSVAGTDTLRVDSLGAVALRYAGSDKLTTGPAGISVTGKVSATANISSNNSATTGSVLSMRGSGGGFQAYSNATQTYFQTTDSAGVNPLNALVAIRAGATYLYHNGVAKIATTAAGAAILGNLDADIYTGDAYKTANTILGSNYINNAAGTANHITWTNGAATNLYYNGAKKLQTTNTGTYTTGQHDASDGATTTHINYAGLYTNRSLSYIRNTHATGTFYVNANTQMRFRTVAGLDTLVLDMVNQDADFYGDVDVAGALKEGGTLLSTKYARLNAANSYSNTSGIQRFHTGALSLIENTGSFSHGMEVYAAAGSDAFMQFHISGDFALKFGLDGSTNKLSVGGWSMGANVYAIYHEGNKPTLNDLTGTAANSLLLGGLAASAFEPLTQSPAATNWWSGGYSKVNGDGTFEIGKYIDFHSTSATTADNTYRMTNTSNGNMTFSGNLNVGDIMISKALPRIVLDSVNSGDNWTSQGAGISLGESGTGSAALHLTYTGNGIGRIGMGSITSGVPAFSVIQFAYNSNLVTIPGTLKVQGAMSLDAGTSGDATFTIRADTDNSNEGDHPSIRLKQDGDAVDFRIGIGATDSDISANGNKLVITSVTGGSGIAYSPDNGVTVEDMVFGNVTGTLFADVISANQINADMIAANQITANLIAANEISANHIAANEVKAGQLEVSSTASIANTIFFDGPGNRIDIKDASNVLRVRIGQL